MTVCHNCKVEANQDLYNQGKHLLCAHAHMVEDHHDSRISVVCYNMYFSTPNNMYRYTPYLYVYIIYITFSVFTFIQLPRPSSWQLCIRNIHKGIIFVNNRHKIKLLVHDSRKCCLLQYVFLHSKWYVSIYLVSICLYNLYNVFGFYFHPVTTPVVMATVYKKHSQRHYFRK